MSTEKIQKKQSILNEVELCLDLVNNLTVRLAQNRKKMAEIKSIKVDTEEQPLPKNEIGTPVIRSHSPLFNLYRLNFPISNYEAEFLMKELCVRLAAKKLQLGAVIDLHGQLFESQIVELMNRKLSYDNAYRLRKTVRYFFQITPFDTQRTRDRIQLIDTVEEKLAGYQVLIGLKSDEQSLEVGMQFSQEQRKQMVKTLMEKQIKYESYPIKIYLPLLQQLLDQRNLYIVMLKNIQEKRTLTTMNLYDALGIPTTMITSYEKKVSTQTTHTQSYGTEQQYILEDCEIQCVPYESVFNDK